MRGRKKEEGGRGRVSPAAGTRRTPAAGEKKSGAPEESLQEAVEGCLAAAIICRVRPGDLIQAEEKICEEPWVHTRLIRNYEVKKIYSHHVLTEDTVTGQRRCFCYGDLVMMGLERQESWVEQVKSVGNGGKYR